MDIYQVRNSSMKRLEFYNSLENKIHAYESESIDNVYNKFKSVFNNIEVLKILFSSSNSFCYVKLKIEFKIKFSIFDCKKKLPIEYFSIFVH